VAETRVRVFEYRVSADPDWSLHSDRGGAAIPRDEAWSPEHLVLAGLARCTLTSLEYHARRAGIEARATAAAHGTVTRREQDDRFAFVDIEVSFEVSLEPHQNEAATRELLAKAERDCFVGASLTVTPTYIWRVDGEEL
jgi:organic hydroperoxide reductase OsmC/OhrA